MNTINSIRPYMAIKNNPQAPATEPTQVKTHSFKGVIGDKIVKDVLNNKTNPSTENILANIKGTFGISTDKAKDIISSFLNALKQLVNENRELEVMNLNLKKQLINTKGEKDRISTRFEETKESNYMEIQALNRIIKEQNKKIAELEKSAAQTSIKSIDEIDTVLPEQFIDTLQRIEENNEAAQKSLFDFIMTGKGQEEFLAQMELNNILLKGIKDGINKIPEVEEAFAKTKKSIGLAHLGNDPYYTACIMLGNILRLQPQASRIQSPIIYAQVKANAEALINPMMNKRYTYSNSVDKEMKEALNYRIAISDATKTATSKNGLEYISETIVDNSSSKSYRTFKNSDGNFVDYSLNSLYTGFWAESRIRTPEGDIIQDNSRIR